MTLFAFFIGICIGILGTAFLYNKNQKTLEKDLENTRDNYEDTIAGLKSEINSYKDIVKSLNKDIENLKK